MDKTVKKMQLNKHCVLNKIIRQTPQSIKETKSKGNCVNIFETTLEKSPLNHNHQSYNFVGWKQLTSRFVKKNKITGGSKKKGTFWAISTSSKNQTTANLSEIQDLVMTKEELQDFWQLKSAANTPNRKQIAEVQCEPVKGACNSQLHNSIKKRQQSLNYLNRTRIHELLNNYLKKVELQNEKQSQKEYQKLSENARGQIWMQNLRNPVQLSKILQKKKQNIKLNGSQYIKITAQSKKKKQIAWLNSQQISTLFEPLSSKRFEVKNQFNKLEKYTNKIL